MHTETVITGTDREDGLFTITGRDEGFLGIEKTGMDDYPGG